MNTQTKHAPGPICTCGVITTVIETGIGCYDENEIAQCPLCKAAPAMYEALKAAADYIPVTSPEGQLIAKAIALAEAK